MKTLKQTYQPWAQTAINLAKTRKHSWREIAKILNAPKSTVSDLLRKTVSE